MKVLTTGVIAVAVLVVAFASTATADDALLAYEAFDYDTGALGEKGSEQDAGWGGDWEVGSSDGLSVQVVEEGLTFSTLETAGRALRLQANLEFHFDRYNRAARALAPEEEVTGTVWHSHLIHIEPETRKLEANENEDDEKQLVTEPISQMHDRWEARVDVDSTGNTDRTGVPDAMGFTATRDGGPRGRLVVAGDSRQADGRGLEPGTTYLVIGKVQGVGGTETVEMSVPDEETGEMVEIEGYSYTADMWVLTEENFEALVESGWDDSVLQDERIQHASTTVRSATKATFSAGDFVQIHTRDWMTLGFSPIYDEIRYGTTLRSVTPAPEPEDDEDDENDE